MANTKRILGLDYGTKTVGVAVSDPLLLTAQGLEIIRREKPTKLRRTLARIEEIIAEYEVDYIVLGYPYHLSGEEGERCQATRDFRDLLTARTGLDVILRDERLTTVEADEIMDEMGIYDRLERKQYVDEIAAMIILQDYLNDLADNK